MTSFGKKRDRPFVTDTHLELRFNTGISGDNFYLSAQEMLDGRYVDK